nr:GGDEF domain-containing protein [Pseudomonas sp. RIT-PI-S]
MSQRVTQHNLQKLFIKRFLLAASSYLMMLMLVGVAFVGGYFNGSTETVMAGGALVLLSQALLGLVFFSGNNLRFADPSLTEAQIWLAVGWETWLLSHLDSARGPFMVIYVVPLMFGLFHLSRAVFLRCAALVFGSFAMLNLYEAGQGRLDEPGLAAIQAAVLFIVLFWLCLYGNYVQASRQRMRQRRFALQAHQDTLRGMMRQLEDLVATDELTGLFNRRHFLRLASRELHGLRPGQTHGLALIDLDHFKRINDVHGHAAGDAVLQGFAQVAAACLREGDVLARYGGEEFVLLMLDSDADRLTLCCERLRLAFAAARPADGAVTSLSLCAGMTLLGEGDLLDDALHRADKALYQAKREGRNRCVAAWEYIDA